MHKHRASLTSQPRGRDENFKWRRNLAFRYVIKLDQREKIVCVFARRNTCLSKFSRKHWFLIVCCCTFENLNIGVQYLMAVWMGIFFFVNELNWCWNILLFEWEDYCDSFNYLLIANLRNLGGTYDLRHDILHEKKGKKFFDAIYLNFRSAGQ